MGNEPSFQPNLRRILFATAISLPVALTPEMSSAESLLDFLFGGSQKQQPQSSFFDKVFNSNLQPPSPARPVDEGPGPSISSGPGFCVRSCDGKYFPLRRGAASPTRLCDLLPGERDRSLLRLQH